MTSHFHLPGQPYWLRLIRVGVQRCLEDHLCYKIQEVRLKHASNFSSEENSVSMGMVSQHNNADLQAAYNKEISAVITIFILGTGLWQSIVG